MTAGFRRPRMWGGVSGFVAVLLIGGALMGVEVVGRELPAVANPSGASPGVFVGGQGSNGNGPVDRLTLSAIVAGGTGPQPRNLGAPVAAMAINPTATKVVFGLQQLPGTALPPSIVVEDLASGTLSLSRQTAGAPVAVVSNPANPALAYVLEQLSNSERVDVVGVNGSLPSDSPLGTSGTGRIVTPQAMAILPDGSTLFVGGQFNGSPAIVGISTSNGSTTTPWSYLNHPGSLVDVAVSPDGSTLYGVSVGFNANQAPDNEILALHLPITSSAQNVLWSHQLTVGTASLIQLGTPTCLTVGPDGSTVYVAGNNAGSGGPPISAVQPFDGASGNAESSMQVPIQADAEGVGGVSTIAISPDGSTLLATGTDEASAPGVTWTYPLSLPQLSLGPGTSLGSAFGTLHGPEEMAITPDQAPTASFSVIPGSAGSPTSFSAAASTVAYGSVSTFAWNFGDGHSATTNGAAVAHTYSAPGSYNVTVTETDSAGTSIPPAVAGTGFAVDGPGQTPYRRADPSARTARTVGIPPSGVTPTTLPGTPPGAPGHPMLALNPALGPPGTLVSVTGSGFPANSAVTVKWSVSTGSVIIHSDGSGDLGPTILPILVPDVLGPRQAVASGIPPASAPFLVVPGSAEPGGDRGSYLFRTEGP